MTKEQLRMQMLAGVITESEYTAVINKEIEEADKASLNESMIGGIVGIGAINQIPATPKTDYEMAFEHFLGSKYINEDETSEMEDEVKDEISMNEEELDESVLAVAGGIVLGILGLKTLARIMKGIFGAVSLIRMTDPKKLKEAVAEIGREAIMKRGKNPLQVALWMTTVNSMIDSGEVKNGVDLGKTWGNIDKIDLETALNSSESEEVESPNDSFRIRSKSDYIAGIDEAEISMNEVEGSEMVDFVKQNFDTIKDNFYKSEKDIITNDVDYEDDEDVSTFISYLDNQINKVSTAEELIDLINDRSIGVDLEGEEASELFDMIKQYASLEEGKEVEEPNNY
jgi:hypothetical protein